MTTERGGGFPNTTSASEEFDRGLKSLDIGSREGLYAVPGMLKILFDESSKGELQPQVKTLDGRDILPIVGLDKLVQRVIENPRLCQEFVLLYFNVSLHYGLGQPLLNQQSLSYQKSEKMKKLLKDIDAEKLWGDLKKEEMDSACVALFDQLLFLLAEKMSGGLVGKMIEEKKQINNF